MAANKYLKEVEEALYSAPAKDRNKDVAFLKKYIGTQYTMIGLNVPCQRRIFKIGYSFSSLSSQKQVKLWDTIWEQSTLHESMTQAIFFWEKNIAGIDIEQAWNCLKGWTGKIDNWAHSDGLSGLYSYLLEKRPALVLPQLKKWNKSKNPWERRQSVVGLIHYHSKRNEVLPYSILIPFIENLLDDEDYFVQKGVGWALREIGNIYHKETYGFLKKNYARISGTAFAAAAEKLNPQEKEELKRLRKEARKK
jgi:3-methyladenine DNA glycosylase AlkD